MKEPCLALGYKILATVKLTINSYICRLKQTFWDYLSKRTNYEQS